MPPRTRNQSSAKAADTSEQEPESERPKGAEPKLMFFKLPPELQKAVVEYVGSIPGRSATRESSDRSHLGYPLI